MEKNIAGNQNKHKLCIILNHFNEIIVYLRHEYYAMLSLFLFDIYLFTNGTV